MNHTRIEWVKNPEGTPVLGEIRSAKAFGGKPKTMQRRIYVRCPQCNKDRWVALPATKRPTYTGLCHDCNAKTHGGNRIKRGYRWINSNGYILIKLQLGDFFYPMSGKDGYVFEHRLVMARYLRRCLHTWEIVHHKNHIRNDNRIENLQLVSDFGHKQISLLESKIARLEKRATILEAENARLQKQVEKDACGVENGEEETQE